MYNQLWHTVDLPIQVIRPDINYDYVISTFDWQATNYKTMYFETGDFCTKEALDWFYKLGLPLMQFGLMFATLPGYQGYLHKDSIHPDLQGWNGTHCKAALNFHITKSTGRLIWYDCPEQGEEWWTEAGTPAERYSLEGRTEITRWQGPDPAICRVDHAHIADNLDGTEPRVVITFRFIPNPDWDLVVRRLQPWIR